MPVLQVEVGPVTRITGTGIRVMLTLRIRRLETLKAFTIMIDCPILRCLTEVKY